jgi:hypothetical protein
MSIVEIVFIAGSQIAPFHSMSSAGTIAPSGTDAVLLPSAASLEQLFMAYIYLIVTFSISEFS